MIDMGDIEIWVTLVISTGFDHDQAYIEYILYSDTTSYLNQIKYYQ